MSKVKIDSQKILQHLDSKWKNTQCPMCEERGWTVQEGVFELRQFSQGSINLGGPVQPVIPVICNTCGNTILINAIKAGLIDPGDKNE